MLTRPSDFGAAKEFEAEGSHLARNCRPAAVAARRPRYLSVVLLWISCSSIRVSCRDAPLGRLLAVQPRRLPPSIRSSRETFQRNVSTYTDSRVRPCPFPTSPDCAECSREFYRGIQIGRASCRERV